MLRIKAVGRCGLSLALAASLSACSWLDNTFPDKSKEYKRAEPAAPLDVPPDLTSTPTSDALVVPSGSATLSGYTSARQSLGQQQQQSGTAVMPAQDNMKFERDHESAWLVIQGDPQAVWPRAREFWLENGFFITRENPSLGTLQTDWVESRTDVPKGAIRSLISRVYENAYSSAYRDRYRMRLERGEQPGTTELYITQQGIEEIVVAGDNDIGDTKWGPRPSDPGLESEMLKRMMIFLGVEPAQAEVRVAEPPPERARAELIQQENGQATLVLHKEFDRAWRDVGIVLDRVSFVVEDRNRLQGLYYVRYSDPQKIRDKGLLSKLAFWSDDDQEVDHYQIKLSDDGADTRVVVLNTEGEPEVSATAVRILNVLYDELK